MQMLRLERNGTLEKLGRNPSWRLPVISIYASLVLITVSHQRPVDNFLHGS